MNDVPRPATVQLLALAAAARPDWPPALLGDVVAQLRCRDDFSFGRLVVAVAQLIADPEAEPPDLLAAVADPWRQRRRPPAPETAQRGAAAARAALHHHPPTT
ncbi:hypothetical protein LZP81_31055 [Streptomyces parvulus]|uniref:hypothetical protein n=1 Tax=Streptomyces parvulus TaxID=146923 RepID=UPI001E4679E5|nr:hypothetical protein [Streptomyces parvulus]MCC9154857.1 hypothetical protein [Streptomyces parvulus]MCE7691298.1 hypothetical protein [Streptomyces parvulus]